MIFITRSGSTYEVDSKTKRIRRLNGKSDPTPRVGKDGEWREYKSLSGPVLGHGLIKGCPAWINWTDKIQPPAQSFAGAKTQPATVTSPVVEIANDTGEN